DAAQAAADRAAAEKLARDKVAAAKAAAEAVDATKVRHLYVIASVSGQVLLYSTVQGRIRLVGDTCVEWTDTKGIQHQHFISGGQLVHVSDEPIVMKGVTINLETQGAKQ
ncbi:hypothetical protein LCGC14_1372260, partial [marine sediment metagenome]